MVVDVHPSTLCKSFRGVKNIMKVYVIVKKYNEYTNRYYFALGIASNRNQPRIHTEWVSAVNEAESHILFQLDEDSLLPKEVYVVEVGADTLKPLLAKKPETLTLAPTKLVQFSEFHGYVDKLELPTPSSILITPLPVIWPTVYLIINYQETTPIIGQSQLFPNQNTAQNAVMLQDVFSYEGCSVVATDLSDLIIALDQQNDSGYITINRLEEYMWLHAQWNRLMTPAPSITLPLSKVQLQSLLQG